MQKILRYVFINFEKMRDKKIAQAFFRKGKEKPLYQGLSN